MSIIIVTTQKSRITPPNKKRILVQISFLVSFLRLSANSKIGPPIEPMIIIKTHPTSAKAPTISPITMTAPSSQLKSPNVTSGEIDKKWFMVDGIKKCFL